MLKKNVVMLLILMLIFSVIFIGCSRNEEVAEAPAVEEQKPEEAAPAKQPEQPEQVVQPDQAEPKEEPETLQEPIQVPAAPADEPKQAEPSAPGQTAPAVTPVPVATPVPVVTPPPLEETAIETPLEQSPSIEIQGRNGEIKVLSLEELNAMANYQYSGSFYWLNSFGSTGHTSFKGIKLWPLIETYGQATSDSNNIKITATDGYTVEFSAAQIKKMDYIDETDQSVMLPIIIAWEENGKPYDPSEGSPFKLIIGQKEPGDVNKPQWVSNISKIIVE